MATKRKPLITYHREGIERLALMHTKGAGLLMDDDPYGTTQWNWEEPSGPADTPLALTVFVAWEEDDEE